MKKLIAVLILVIAVVCISCNTHERCPAYAQTLENISNIANL